MRTTLTLEQDVAHKAKSAVARLGWPLKKVVNEALRRGLEQMERPPASKPYRTRPRKLGLREDLSLDNVQQLLDQVEGDDVR